MKRTNPLAVPEHLERRYELLLLRRCRRLKEAVNGALAATGVRKDTTAIQVQEARLWLTDIEQAFSGTLPAEDVARIFDATNRYTTRGLAAALTRTKREEVTVEDVLGIKRYELPTERAAFVADNATLIKSIDARYLADVQRIIEQAAREGWSNEQLSAELQRRYAVSKARATLIAEDQVSKVHGQVNEARQTALGIESYTWRANRDSLTRPLHAKRNGKSFRWDSPPNEEPGDGPPGEPINCRCFAEPELPA